MFKKGFKVAREQDEKMKKAQENAGRKIFDFFLTKDGEEADVVFLTEEPINFEQHDIREKGQFKSYVCSGDNCSICDSGDEPKYKGAFLVWDKRPFSYEKDGKTVNNEVGAIRVYARGIKDVTQLDRISTKYGLASRMITIIRNGTGQNTSYTFERGDKIEVTDEEIRSLLPDKLREDYNGTEESLYDILIEQLKIRTKDSIDEYEEDYNEEEYENDDVIIGTEENVEEKKGKKKKLSAKKSMFKAR